jgi:hypothetical protein
VVISTRFAVRSENLRSGVPDRSSRRSANQSLIGGTPVERGTPQRRSQKLAVPGTSPKWMVWALVLRNRLAPRR